MPKGTPASLFPSCQQPTLLGSAMMLDCPRKFLIHAALPLARLQHWSADQGRHFVFLFSKSMHGKPLRNPCQYAGECLEGFDSEEGQCLASNPPQNKLKHPGKGTFQAMTSSPVFEPTLCPQAGLNAKGNKTLPGAPPDLPLPQPHHPDAVCHGQQMTGKLASPVMSQEWGQ